MAHEAIGAGCHEAGAFICHRHEAPCRTKFRPGPEDDSGARHGEKASRHCEQEGRVTLQAAGKGEEGGEEQAEGREVCKDRAVVATTLASARVGLSAMPTDAEQHGSCEGEQRCRTKDYDERWHFLR